MLQFKNSNDLLNMETISQIIEKSSDLKVKSITPFAAGQDNQLFLVNEMFIYRFVKQKEGAECMLQEFVALEFLSNKLSVAIPELIFKAEHNRLPFCAYKKLAGTIACNAKTSMDDYFNIAKELGVFLKGLHSISVNEAMDVNLRFDWKGKANSYSIIPSVKKLLVELNSLGLVKHFNTFSQLLEVVAQEHIDSSRQICHGDLRPNHLLIDKGHLTGVLDWGDCSISSPGIDLAIVYSYLHPRTHDHFWKSYATLGQGQHMLGMFKSLQVNLMSLQNANTFGDEVSMRMASESLNNLELSIRLNGFAQPNCR